MEIADPEWATVVDAMAECRQCCPPGSSRASRCRDRAEPPVVVAGVVEQHIDRPSPLKSPIQKGRPSLIACPKPTVLPTRLHTRACPIAFWGRWDGAQPRSLVLERTDVTLNGRNLPVNLLDFREVGWVARVEPLLACFEVPHLLLLACDLIAESLALRVLYNQLAQPPVVIAGRLEKNSASLRPSPLKSPIRIGRPSAKSPNPLVSPTSSQDSVAPCVAPRYSGNAPGG